jgi:hypothetical protein
MRRVAVVLLALAVTGFARGAAVRPEPLLALIDMGLDRPARLVSVDPRTLEVQARGPRMPGWAFGLEYARSPDGRRLAVFPRPSDSVERLFFVDVQALRVVGRIDLGNPACAAAWPSPRRLVLVVASPPCYSGDNPLEELVVDPVERTIVTRRPISGAAVILDAEATEDGLALLLGPHRRTGPARLALVGTDGVRTTPLPGVRAGGRDLALAVDPAGRRAYVAEPDWTVTEVDLVSGIARRHVSSGGRRLAAAEKGAVGRVIDAAWAGGDALALAGGLGRRDGSFTPEGARLINTRTWKMRLLNSAAASVVAANGLIVTFQGSYGERANLAQGTGAAVYTRSGRFRYRALRGKRVELVRTARGYAYVFVGAVGGAVFELRTGRQTAHGIDGTLVWSLLVGERG